MMENFNNIPLILQKLSAQGYYPVSHSSSGPYRPDDTDPTFLGYHITSYMLAKGGIHISNLN